jgi:ankyrin repeat protein
MNLRRRPHSILISCCRIAGVLAIPLVLTWRQVRQTHLNDHLILAVIQNDAPRVRSLLRQGADPNPSWSYAFRSRTFWQILLDGIQHRSTSDSTHGGEPLLAMAIELGGYRDVSRLPVVEALLDAGASVNTTDESLLTPLQEAIRLRQPGTVQALLRHHADVNFSDQRRFTALMLAAAREDADTVETLLNNGARIDSKDSNGNTALFYAFNQIARTQSSDAAVRATVACLLRHGAAVNHKNANGVTVMALARQYSPDDQLIRMLKRAGAK